MKHKAILMLICFLCLNSFAQDFKYGVTASFLLSHPKGYKSHAGYNIGMLGEYSFSDSKDSWYISPSLLFSAKGWKDRVGDDVDANSYDWNCNVYYMELPVLIGYKYYVNERMKLSFGLGPYLAYGLFGNSKIDIEDSVDDNNIFSSGAYKRFDYGIKTYVGVDFSKWRVGIGWSKSMQKPTKGKWDTINPKDMTYSFQVSYMIR